MQIYDFSQTRKRIKIELVIRPVLCRDVAHVNDGLGVVGVDVEDGSVDHTSHVSAIPRRSREPGVSGEPDLNGRMSWLVH